MKKPSYIQRQTVLVQFLQYSGLENSVSCQKSMADYHLLAGKSLNRQKPIKENPGSGKIGKLPIFSIPLRRAQV